MNLILIGQKSSGKTTIGKILAKKLNLYFIDTDNLIFSFFFKKNKINKNCREIYKILDFQKFRELESTIIKNLSCKNTIIATGGGIIENLKNLENLKKLGTIIYLKTDFQQILERIQLHQNFPANILKNNFENNFKIIYMKRDFLFNSFSPKISIYTKNKTVEKIVGETIAKINMLQTKLTHIMDPKNWTA